MAFKNLTQSQNRHRYFGVHRTGKDPAFVYTFRYHAPSATEVSLVGDFVGWEKGRHMTVTEGGAWEYTLTTQASLEGQKYKFKVRTHEGVFYRADPYAFHKEKGGEGASLVMTESHFYWSDGIFLKKRQDASPKPLSLYEVDLSLYRAEPSDYQSLAHALVSHVKALGCTHISLLGFDLGFAPDNRFGTPDDFRFFVNKCHGSGVSLLLPFAKADDTPDFLSLLSYLVESFHIDGFVFSQEAPKKLLEAARALDAALLLIGDDPLCDYCFDEVLSQRQADYFSHDPIERRFYHDSLSLVPHGTLLTARPHKKALLKEMHGSYEDKFSNLRLFCTLQAVLSPRVVYMGNELAPFTAYCDSTPIEWYMTDFDMHKRFYRFYRDLGELCLAKKTLWQGESRVLVSDADKNLFGLLKTTENELLAVIFNCSGVPITDLSFPLPDGEYTEIFSTDEGAYGGGDRKRHSAYQTKNGQITLDIPPLSAVMIQPIG